MSEIKLVLRDATRDVSGTLHGLTADRTVAALSAEPETLEELAAAIERFEAGGSCLLQQLRPGLDDRSYDAGVVIIDLAARLIAFESTYSSPGRTGCVDYHDGTRATDVPLGYALPDDWAFQSHVINWESTADVRRRERAARPQFDAREILYGQPILEWIGRACWRVVLDPKRAEHAATDAIEIPLSDPSFGAGPHVEDVRRMHIRWLMTPRDDLAGQTPRDVLLARRELIDSDLQHRANQWSRQQTCPPALDPNSHAFRFAGFGTHENVIYYDFVRKLIWSCVERAEAIESEVAAKAMTVGDFLAAEVPRLATVRDEWWNTADSKFGGLSPRLAVEHERARLPEGVCGHDADLDPDCPACQMLAELPGPMFWHLDGCNNDPDFAFSIFHRTREEWEAEERRYQEFNRRFDAERKEQKVLQLDVLRGSRSSYTDPDYAGGSPAIRLHALGTRLAELLVDLRQPHAERALNEERQLIDRLRREFGNLREITGTAESMLGSPLAEPVAQKLSETLHDVAESRADLQPPCEWLQKALHRFLNDEDPRGFSNPTDFEDDDVPW
jgi:hypothetical protein